MAGDEAFPQYEERYCAFVDILGFRSLLDGLRTGAQSPDDIRILLTRVHTTPGKHWFELGKEEADYRAQSISDAIAISASCNLTGLAAVMSAVQQLALTLLGEGYFVRGAICKGPLYHDDKMIFGDALVRAYKLESDIAKYPRVMISSDVVLDASSAGYEPNDLDQYIAQADDGPHFLNILKLLEMGVGDTSRIPEFEAIARKIQKRYDESRDTPNHFEKIRWFANYWNDTLYKADGATRKALRVVGPGLDPKPAAWG